jgi:histidine triad (HIT) family protein
MTMDCIFCGIATGEIPAKIVAQTDNVVAFKDINPQAPLHVQVIPIRHIVDAAHLEADDAGVLLEMTAIARHVAQDAGYDVTSRGYRLVMNVGPDSQSTVPHLHLHVLAGRSMTWPPG